MFTLGALELVKGVECAARPGADQSRPGRQRIAGFRPDADVVGGFVTIGSELGRVGTHLPAGRNAAELSTGGLTSPAKSRQ
jgi:hypothetical protein